MMGYAGLRFDEKGLLFNPLPNVLIPSTKTIRLRNLLVHATYPFDYTLDRSSMSFITPSRYENLLCVSDNLHSQWRITSEQLKLDFADIQLPIRVDLCV